MTAGEETYFCGGRKLRSKPSPAAKILVESYWDSSESKKLFLGDSNDERDVVKVLELWIERLQQANKTSGGWCNIIDKLWH